MTIYLYHIEGISETDTLCPLLDGEYDAQGFGWYIQNGLVKEVQSSYYPPYYKNTITLSDDDATFDSTINYVGLYDEDSKKFYYYFVREYHYVSESIISLSIEMDVIMTYMTNIRLSNIVIERKFINRWRGSFINRDYIRENASNGDFKLISYSKLPISTNVGWYIIKASNCLLKNVYSGDAIGTRLDCNTAMAGTIKSPYYYYFIPINIGRYKYISSKTLNLNPSGSEDKGNRWNILKSSVYEFPKLHTNWELNDSAIVSCTYIPYDIFNCSVSYDGNTLILPDSLLLYANSLNNIERFINYYIYYPDDTEFFNTNKNYTYPYNQYEIRNNINVNAATINKEKKVLFDKRYAPCLIDENYYRVSLGDGGNECSYPLYYLPTPGIIYYFCCDLMSGIRTYNLSSAYLGSYDYPTFNNSTINSINVLTPELMTDAYNTWYAQNRATLLAGISASTINGAFNFANQAISNHTRISNNKTLRSYNYRTDMKNIRLNNDTSEISKYNARRRRDAPIPKASYDFSNPLGFLISYGAESLNNYYANDIPKVVQSIIPDINAKTYIPYYKIYEVADIDYCAWYYHMNGYLVMERHDNCSLIDLMKYVHNRLYFNVLKLADCDVHLDGCIESTELTSLIKARLIKGMRLWDTGQGEEGEGINLEYLKYDNIELSNLNK